MKLRLLHYAFLRVNQMVPILVLLLFSAGFLAAQATVSAGPLLLHQVKTIYVAPSSDEFVSLIRAGLERWNAVRITPEPAEADAILTCQTESTIVPAKVLVRRTTAEITLVDHRTQKTIWKTTKSRTFDTTRLADDVIEQLKKDWRKSATEYEAR